MATNNASIYFGFPYISPIRDFVKNELYARCENRNRAYTPYIKVSPGLVNDGFRPIMRGIEDNNKNINPHTFGFNELYDINTGRPIAGVQSITIDYKNKFGSVKKASLNWRCNTMEDMERLYFYFMNPGMTLLVEWGWSHTADIANLQDDFTTPGGDTPNIYTYYKNYVKPRIEATGGNYDAIMGFITNFSWSYNKDLSLSCTTEITSGGVLMEGMDLMFQVQYGGANGVDAESEDTENEQKDSQLITTLHEYFKNDFYWDIYLKYVTKPWKNKSPSDVSDFGDINEPKPPTTSQTDAYIFSPNEQMATELMVYSVTEGEVNDEGVAQIPNDSPIYISWGFVEDYILSTVASNISTNQIDDRNLWGVDSRYITIFNDKDALRSTDPEVCLIPNYNDAPDESLRTEDDSWWSWLWSSTDAWDNYQKTYDNIKNTTLGSDQLSSELLSYNDTEEYTGYDNLYIRNILINAKFLQEVALASTTLVGFIETVFSKINNVCGNVWNFQVRSLEEGTYLDINAFQQIVESDDSVATYKEIKKIDYTENEGNIYPFSNYNAPLLRLAIVDLNHTNINLYYNENKTPFIFRLKPFALNSSSGQKVVSGMIRDINLETNLGNQEALNIMYSAHRNDKNTLGTPNLNAMSKFYGIHINSSQFENLKDIFSLEPYSIKQKLEEKDKNTKDAPSTKKDPENEEEKLNKAKKDFASDYDSDISSVGVFMPYAAFNYNPTFLNNIDSPEKHPLNTKITYKEWLEVAGLMSEESDSSEWSSYQGGAALMKRALQFVDDKRKGYSQGIVKLNCTIKLDGISGIRIGDVFTLDYLPDRYKEMGFFQINNIKHTINKGSWETEVGAIYRIHPIEITERKIANVSSEFSTSTSALTPNKSTYDTTIRKIVPPEGKEEIIETLTRIWKDKSIFGFSVSDSVIEDAKLIIQAESSFQVDAHNDRFPDDSYGLFQINMLTTPPSRYDLKGERQGYSDISNKRKSNHYDRNFAIAGIPKGSLSPYNLFDMETNIKVAKYLFKRAGYSWRDWSTQHHAVNAGSKPNNRHIV